jgi:anti-anti-sigma factor
LESERVITVTDDLSPGALTRLAGKLADAVARFRLVVVDMSAATRLDSRILCAIVAADKRARAAGHLLVLTGVGGQTARILEQTGLDRHLEIASPRAAKG